MTKPKPLKIGDMVITRYCKQIGRIVIIQPLPLSTVPGASRLHIKVERRVVVIDSDMVEPYKAKTMTLNEIMEQARRLAAAENKPVCVYYCPTSGYNLMMQDRAKASGKKITVTVFPPNWKQPAK